MTKTLKDIYIKPKRKTLRNVSKEMQQRIIKAMTKTWNYIGHDIFMCEGVNEDLSQSNVIDLVMDAGRVKSFGGDPEAAEVLYQMTITSQNKLGKRAFPLKRYGM